MELSAPARRWLDRRIPDMPTCNERFGSWQKARNPGSRTGNVSTGAVRAARRHLCSETAQ
jgi:hypothetical protein